MNSQAATGIRPLAGILSEQIPGAPREAGLLDRNRLLTTLISNLVGMIYRCRLDENWTMEFVSDGCFELTGYAPEELLLNARGNYEQITHPDDRARVRRAILDALARNSQYDVEYRLLHCDGCLRWVWERGVGVMNRAGEPEAIEGFIQDITQRHAADDALRETERRYRSIFEHATEGIFQTTPDGRYINANPALASIYGYATPAELIADLSDIQHQLYVDPERRREFVRLMRQYGYARNFESHVFRRDGSIFWISENARAVRDENGEVQFYEGTVVEITERKRYQEELEYQASHDSLTGLPNRALLVDRLKQTIHAARRDGRVVAVAFVDLDHFKLINDSLGHHVGDRLLLDMAERLRACVRSQDTVARQGGDEFVLILADQPDEAGVTMLIRRVLEAVAQPWAAEHGEYSISCSIGVSLFPRDGKGAEALLKCADLAMFKAKDIGRNTFQFFTPELNGAMIDRLEVANGLRRGLERNEFLLHYQPRVDLASGRIVGAEALIRWQRPDQALTPPGQFIPVAEETGLIVPIGAWALREACAQNIAWQAMGLPPIVVSVNLSPIQFRRAGLVAEVANTLRETGLEARWLELELTESFIMQDAERINQAMAGLKALGVEIAVDDFGTGYSSLSYLKRFPVDRLKIDKSFVQDVNHDPDDAAIARAIISLGHSLNLRVVAEGVETEAQLEFMRAHGCDEIQGYFFSRPVLATEFEAMLLRQRDDYPFGG
ncbi:MAG: GGDEF domain-containing protein [Hydrogenophilales bacterium 28-61-23]|nr:MAG: GGDEF domain-containing protein [Hydrogenophilales bacterium 28-61-23]